MTQSYCKALKPLLFIGLLSVLVACAPYDDDDSEQASSESTAPTKQEIPTSFSFNTEVQAEREPDRYSVKISWKTESPNVGGTIQRTDSNGNAKIFPTENGHQGTLSDQFVTAGESYTYQLLQNDSEGTKLRASKSVNIPKDVVLSGSVSVDKFGKLAIDGRLFLQKATLNTSGNSVHIKVSEIHSDDSNIETFPKGQRASVANNGRAGGIITVESLRAHGTLSIFARGEDGGDGNTGNNGFTGRDGVKGLVAKAGVNPRMTEAMQNSYRQVMAWLIEKGIDHQGEWGKTDFTGQPYFICAREAGDGEAGVDGGPGHDGGDGATGGDSGTVFINIAEESDLKINLVQEPGMGGNQGLGGKGGPGGNGGPPGDGDIGRRCTTPAKPGPSGNRGRDGNPGRAGRPGLVKPYCIQIGEKTQGDCHSLQSAKE